MSDYFFDPSQKEGRTIAEGVRIRTYWKDNMLLSHVTLQPGAVVPIHSHHHEQGGIMISGTLTFTIGDEVRECKAGDMYIIPGDVKHGVVAGPEGAIVLDIFSPVREAYMF
jgi:quercetin dioxygenase-like cupin family protein